MLQFTQPGKRRGLFGTSSYSTPGDMPDAGMVPGGNPGGPMPQQQGGGFFGEGGAGRGIAGTLGDFLLQQSGMAPVYAPQMQLRHRAEQEEAQYQRRQQDEQATWMEREQWKRANPSREANPYRFEDNAGNVYERGQDGQNQLIFTDPNDKTFMNGNQLVTVPNVVRQQQGGGVVEGATATNPTTGEKVQFRGGQWIPMGGAAPAGARPFAERGGFVPPMRLRNGAMTSGRRTPEGNRAVGGVPDSAHLRGNAADYDGTNLNALLAEARRLPGVRKAFIHDGHVHTEGEGWSAPYYGKRGTQGLRK